MNGEAFFTGSDCYGAEMVVRLSAVVAVSLATPEVIAVASADAKADRLMEEG